MGNAKHTPVPWQYRTAKKALGDEKLDTCIFAEIDGANRIIAECFGRVGQGIFLDSEAHAAFIVRAVNNYAQLVEALKRAQPMLYARNKQDWATVDFIDNALRHAEEVANG